MKITLIGDEDGVAYPHFICHVCGNPITDVRFGIVVWFKQNLRPAERCDGFVVHKRECDKALQRMYSPNPSRVTGQSLELYRLGELTKDHPSMGLARLEPSLYFPIMPVLD